MEQRLTPGPPGLFDSFWLAGFESACHINSQGVRLDMLASTQHDVQAAEDYGLLREMGFRTARDGIRWHRIDRAGHYDFSSLAPMVQAAQKHGIQVIWNLCHYGWPDDLDLFSPEFITRFARFCRAVARYIGDHSAGVPFFAPVNEISFLCWAISTGGFIFPYARGRGGEVKRQLVRAVIAGSEAIWEVAPQARLVHADPIFHVVPPHGRPDLATAAAGQRASQFEVWDMLRGSVCPELGGHPRYLDIIGVNFYHANEWEYPDVRLRWEDNPRDERWVPFHQLLAEAYARYQRPFFVAETSHFGVGRGPWIKEIAAEVAQARRVGVPVEGICLYPILDRHDWENPDHWHNSGLWDVLPNGQGRLQRLLNAPYASELSRDEASWPNRGGLDTF